MTFGTPQAENQKNSGESLEMARVRLAEQGEMADRAVRYHLAEAMVLELIALRKEVANLREDMKARG